MGVVAVVWVQDAVAKPDAKGFDLQEIGRLESAMWRSYYEGRWVQLASQTMEGACGQYGLSWWEGSRSCLHAARAALFFLAHGHPGGVRSNIEDFGLAGAGGRFSFLPGYGALARAANHALDLSFGDGDAAGLRKVEGSLEEAGFIRSSQADETREGRGAGPFQTEGRIRREVAAFVPGMVVVPAHQQEGAEHALNHERLAPLGLLRPAWGCRPHPLDLRLAAEACPPVRWSVCRWLRAR